MRHLAIQSVGTALAVESIHAVAAIARKMAVSAICITSLLMQGPNAALSESTNAMLAHTPRKWVTTRTA